MPSDRLQVEWWLDRSRKQVLLNHPEEDLIDWCLNEKGLPKPKQLFFYELAGGQKLLLSVPTNYRLMIRENFKLAVK
ncbi:MAG: hypothetical protein AAGU27_14915 [Dehalobacterium sp.]